MNCPKCNKKAISALRFFFKISPRNIKCQDCGSELKFAKRWKRAFYIIIAVALLLGFFTTSEWSANILGFQFSSTIVFVAFLVVAAIADYLIWSFGTLEEYEPKQE